MGSGWVSEGRRCGKDCGSLLGILGCGSVLRRSVFDSPPLFFKSNEPGGAIVPGLLSLLSAGKPEGPNPGLWEAIVILYPTEEGRLTEPY